MQEERKERNQKRRQSPEDGFSHLSLEELLVGVVVPPSGVAPPQEEDDSDESMPSLVAVSSAGDVPVPEDDSDNEYTNASIYAGRVIKKLHDDWVDEDPPVFLCHC